jgi:glucan phosphoethanolaminetransferase (alkaline phosphatase superfamily)
MRLYLSVTPRFNPNEIRFTICNSIKTFCGFLIITCKKYEIKQYKPYEIVELKSNLPKEMNIVYIIGESVNHKYMSLFGCEQNTTPLLKDLLVNNDTCYFTQGIAGSISTLSSIKFMMNAIGEADNPIQTSKDITNLFRLAKRRGFRTFYISSQTEHMLSSIGGANYMDVRITKDSNPLECGRFMDEYLLKNLDKQVFGKRNFIVLHQRCIHSPYRDTFSKNYKDRNIFHGSKNKIMDEYKNAMHYNDYIISAIFKKFNKQKNGKFYIIFASDHNELMGEMIGGKEIYGHGHGLLLPETADIPILIQSNDKDFITKIKKIFKPTHYEIAKSIAYLLGYEVHNPNERDDTFYISGIDYNGKCGFIKLKKNLKLKKIEYSVK